MDTVLLVSIALIFITALFSNILQRRKRDRVLREMQNFHITMQYKDDVNVWGKARIYANGLEFIYTDSHQNSYGDMTTSYIIQEDELSKVWAFFRYHNELSPKNQLRREKEVRNTINPSFILRFSRWFRNILNAFNDAINEALSVFLNRMKSSGVGSLKQQNKYIQNISTSALGLMGNVYNPILERYIHRRVVIVINTGERKQTYCGFLKEYSPHWISLLDCQIRQKHSLELDDVERLRLQRDIDMEILITEEEGDIKIDFLLSYYGVYRLKIIEIQSSKKGGKGDYYQRINQMISSKGSFSMRVENLPKKLTESIDIEQLPVEFNMIAEERSGEEFSPIENEIYRDLIPALKLNFFTMRIADIYAPRSTTMLRSGADYIDDDD
ncbi:MAG: hypothetical protein KAH22_05610 [Thiotrichaceae bacterium]|nr:hypothetical protein [Thiotrichaceae bacterium]